MDSLTEQEARIIQEMLSGHTSDKEIAYQLRICTRTVANHLRNIYTKLDVGDRLALALYVIRAGWFDAHGRRRITAAQAQHIDERININLQRIGR